MKDDAAYLSIDFLAGFTVFMVAFIWVATMIPGLLTGITGTSIDYDAVAYRTGVILVEDPGMPAYPPWENKMDDQKDEVERMGLALSKDTPAQLSPIKIDRFFCSTVFGYPDDYQKRIIFGDRPYLFNISVMRFDETANDFIPYKSVGDILPGGGYGYIRRFVTIKELSNATIDATAYKSADISGNHTFSVNLSMPYLYSAESHSEYQINALHEMIRINITGLNQCLADDPNTWIRLMSVTLYSFEPSPGPAGTFSPFPKNQNLSIDGSPIINTVPHYTTAAKTGDRRPLVTDSISITYPNGFDDYSATGQSQLFLNISFGLENKTAIGQKNRIHFINNSYNSQNDFTYDYNPNRVTQPYLLPGIVEVAVW